MRLIDADALKAYIDAQKGRPFIGCTIGEALKIMTDEQPTIEPEQRWIPCSERLPELTEGYTDCEGFRECDDGTYEPDGIFTDFESAPVLVCGAKGMDVAVYIEWRFEDGRETETEWRDAESGDIEITNVTAWMPLPSPYEVSQA